ncbi:MAG: amidohydrolase family protein, partial [Acidobacteria bacterium]|nr:amidohydrolase family protein [Acidobacteriota bacterium]
MRSFSVALQVAGFAGLALTLIDCDGANEVDTILRGAIVYDGTGSAGRRADIAIDDGAIVAIGSVPNLSGRQELDLDGRAIAPGFVDIHSHADLILLADEPDRNRLLEAKMRQGVTTIIVGNCGLGATPADEASATILDAVNAWMTPEHVAPGPMGIAEYLGRLEAAGLPLNVATLVPHGPLRIGAMGLSPGPPDETQARAIETALRESLEAGAYGLSVGLIYPPGMYSDTDELIALARIVVAADGLFAAHIRGSSETLAEATAELIAIARATNVRAHHSHLEAVGSSFWREIDQVLATEDGARSEGLAISHDVFPYTRAATMMSAIFPPWSLSGGIPELLERLKDPETRERIRTDLERRSPEWPPWRPGGWPHNLVGAVGWDGIYVASVGPTGPAHYVGRDLQTIAVGEGRDPYDVVADLMLSERGRVGPWVGEISGDEDVRDGLLTILAHPAAAVISDAEDYGKG